MKAKLEQVFSRFDTGTVFLSGERYGSGHIHETFIIRTKGKYNNDYILQGLNRNVFRDIVSLQSNIERVTSHIRSKLLNSNIPDINRRVLTLIPEKGGKTWFEDNEGACWRLYIYISDHLSYDIVDSPEKAYQGGKGIGMFQAQLADMQGPDLFETIPFFHNIEKRLETFHRIVSEDIIGRVQYVSEELEFIKSRENDMKIILKLGKEGKIPTRITHNDTKFNNILLDSNDRALCVIDLDTVMPGYIHYDFGDAIRTAASSAAEDETDLAKVFLNIELFQAYARGYLEEIGETLNKEEIQHLAFAPILITYTIGLRFLSDYLDGDKYFRTHHEDHNLDRTRAQLKLVTSMEEQFDEMNRIIFGLSGRSI